MKIVKLRQNQHLYKQGFTHAFRFVSWEKNYGNVIAALNQIYNNRRWRGKYYAWEIDASDRVVESDNGRWVTKIWIGVRTESIVTQVLLMLQQD